MICPICQGKLYRVDEDTVEPCPECIGGRSQCCEGAPPASDHVDDEWDGE